MSKSMLMSNMSLNIYLIVIIYIYIYIILKIIIKIIIRIIILSLSDFVWINKIYFQENKKNYLINVLKISKKV